MASRVCHSTCPVLASKGTILRTTSYFDTTTANKNMSDPRNWSGLGQRSVDNMAIATVTILPLSDEQFEQEMAKRRHTLQLRAGEAAPGCPLCGYQKNARMVAAAQ